MLAGEGATAFAKMIGMQEEDLGTGASRQAHASWISASCQPNYFRYFDGADSSCPPYPPLHTPKGTSKHGAGDAASLLDIAEAGMSTSPDGGGWRKSRSADPARLQITEENHDTIGMVVVDKYGDIACGTTTNGAANKIAGRVGDSPVAGAGCFVDNDVGGAAATGDGDVMMRCVLGDAGPVVLVVS